MKKEYNEPDSILWFVKKKQTKNSNQIIPSNKLNFKND